jgi:hypothetical protein
MREALLIGRRWRIKLLDISCDGKVDELDPGRKNVSIKELFH